MKDKIPFSQKKSRPVEYPGERAEANREIQALALPYAARRETIPLEDIDKILSIMESYLSRYGLVQICIEANEWEMDSSGWVADLELTYETEVVEVGCGWAVGLTGFHIARFYASQHDDYVRMAQKAGRDIYYALRKKHPLLTRDLSVKGWSNHKAVYEIVCENCGRVVKRFRMCEIVEHPERYRCRVCHGRLVNKGNAVMGGLGGG